MSKLNCPVCHKKAMHYSDKLTLSPFNTKKCASCAVDLSVPYYVMLIPLIPLFCLLFALFANVSTDSTKSPALPILGLAVALFLLNLVPLRAK